MNRPSIRSQNTRLNLLSFMWNLLQIANYLDPFRSRESLYKKNNIELFIFFRSYEITEDELECFLSDQDVFIPPHWFGKITKLLKTTKDQEHLRQLQARLFPKKLKDPVFYETGGAITSDRPGYGVPRREPGYKVPHKR